MGTNKPKMFSVESLRLHAEGQLQTKKSELAPPAKTDHLRLLHELEVHQVELEMQNDELRLVQAELESSKNEYAELFDFAPIAYFTFDENGLVLKVNHAGADLLETERGMLTNAPFSSFIADTDQRELFGNHLRLVLLRTTMLKCAIKLAKSDGSVCYGQLQSLAITSEDGNRYILTSVVDVSIRKQFEEMQKKAYGGLEIIVTGQTEELSKANTQLRQEIGEHKAAEVLLRAAYAEIKLLKDRLHEENIYLQQEVASQHNFGEIVGQSKALSRVFLQVEQVAPMNATVLLLGETGTGKGLVARAIHGQSGRKGRPLITVDCTTLPAALVESELFGRERGAFTGSDSRQIGRFELADGGTIFLDEIGEMPMELQSKLLRVIQDGEFERLGSPRTYKTDVRIIAATNRNMAEDVKNGKFREDLYYRLNVFPILMPPLRDRAEDIPLLVHHFVAKFNKKIGKKIEIVSNETLNALQGYSWPGNVRELESVVERAVIISQGSALQVLDRFDTFKKAEKPAGEGEGEGEGVKALVELEHDHILQVLKKTGWRIEGKNGAAILLGLNASTLRARMRKYGIVRG